MKKLLPLLVVILVVGGIYLFASSRKASPPPKAAAPTAAQNAGSEPAASNDEAPVNLPPPVEQKLDQAVQLDGGNPALDDGEQLAEIKPATEAFSSAEQALEAVTKGAKDYDDSVLEQFTQPGEDCTWCPAFYHSVRDLVTNPATPQDQKSYLAEIMAISGRVENIQTLSEAIKSAKSTDEADLFAEAIELSVGKEDVTRYLGDQMTSTNETLREASVAAVTNQGSRLAAELLVKHTVERGDPDGYYSLGIGLGEFIPDEEAMPALQEMVQKRDPYSHLAVKALINSGMQGLKTVMDELENSTDAEADKRMLKDAIDHVNFEDGLEEYLRQKAENTKKPVVSDFAKRILEEFSQHEAEDPNMSVAP